MHPPPERFARLVTQLKWRLLAGAGQAYYELGVADSGALVGLSRKHLEESLMTLEEMAGEIGASVVVVKEIELPPALVAAAQLQVYGTGGVGALRMPKTRSPGVPVELEFSTSAGTESTAPSSDGDEETDLSTPEDASPSPIGDDAPARDTASSLYLSPSGWTCTSRSFPHSFAETALSQSQAFAVVTRSKSNASSNELNLNLERTDSQDEFGDTELEFEIASVYKPRPYRRRPALYALSSTLPPPLSATSSAGDSDALSPPPSVPVDVPALRAGKRGKKSDKNRLKLKGEVHAQTPQLIVDVGPTGSRALGRPTDTVGTRTHMRALDELEEAAALFGAFSFGDESEPESLLKGNVGEAVGSTESLDRARIMADDAKERAGAGVGGAKSAGADAFHRGQLVAEDMTQKRFIVEALVVRKMSLDDASMDFMTI